MRRAPRPAVFIMPAEGGTPRQLTFHSAGDTVVGWSRDSRRVIFQSARGLLFPGIPNLYEVPATGGLEQSLLTEKWVADRRARVEKLSGDVYVDNPPEDFFKGRDTQLEKAVEVLKEELKNRPKGVERPGK